MKYQREFSEEKRKLLSHVIVYLIVMTGLVLINLLGNPEYFWALWPMLGWGLGVIFHALNIYFFTKYSSVD